MLRGGIVKSRHTSCCCYCLTNIYWDEVGAIVENKPAVGAALGAQPGQRLESKQTEIIHTLVVMWVNRGDEEGGWESWNISGRSDSGRGLKHTARRVWALS